MSRNRPLTLLSGTGSVGFARCGSTIYRVGGWGYLLDRGGSAYDFGRDALYYTLCAFDKRSESTALAGLLEKELGMPVHKAVSEIYRQGKTRIASLAPIVFKALRQGDAVARRIVEENMSELAKVMDTLSSYMAKGPFTMVLVGSMFRDFSDMKPILLQYLHSKYRFVMPELPPVYGSAIEAMALAGIEPGHEFVEAFKKSLS